MPHLIGILCFLLGLAVEALAQNETLAQLASARGKYFGTAVAPANLASDPQYASGVKAFNMFTPENEMKWEVIEPEQGVFNFTGADEVYNLANATGSRVRAHNFCWDQQTPEWVTSITDPDELTSVLENHINQVLGRYKGRTFAVDVINEPISDNANGSINPSVWFNVLGPSYISTALKIARAADPSVKLYINDFGIEDVNTKSTALLNIVTGLVNDSVPIDGIGFESHFIGGEFPGDISESMKRFTDLGLQVALTELDVRLAVPANDSELQQQASDYSSAVQACLGNDLCPGVTVWEFTDKDSWVPGSFPGQGAADLFDENFNPKPAFFAVEQTLAA